MSILVVTDQNFETEVLKNNKPVLVKFYADWCGPCQMLNPTIEELASSYQGKVKFIKINVDTNQEIAQKYNILSIPTVVLFKDSQPVSQIIGISAKERFEEEIKKVLEG